MEYKKFKFAYLVRLFIFIICILFGCSQSKLNQKEYFVRPCEFVCNYPFNDTTKWVITCRVWGLLKYYHPNVAAGKLDWDNILLDRMNGINSSSSSEKVNAELKAMLEMAGEYTCKKDDLSDSLKMNVNLCWLDNSFLDDTLKCKLREIASLSVEFPSRYGMVIDSVEKRFNLKKEKSYGSSFIYNAYEYRLLSLFRYWNVIYYFFPHKYLMDKSWDKTLAESVFPFLNATDKQSYQIAFLKLAASLNDGHGFATIANSYSAYSINTIEKVEGKTVVKIDAGELKKGDVVNSIGKRAIDQIRDSLSVLIPASTKGNKEYRINCYVADMIFFHETDVTIERDHKVVTIHTLPVTLEYDRCSYKKISDSIGYVDLTEITTEELGPMFQSFSDLKGIIFDVRLSGSNYPSNDLLCCYLSEKKIIQMFPKIFSHPEQPGAFVWLKNVPLVISDNIKCSKFNGKKVYLINESTQSSLETKAWEARTSFNATLIGRPTSGALGQAMWITLPGNDKAVFSSAGLFSLDGAELQRKGIVPDIEVYPTMETIKSGKDEILEAAIEYLR